MFFLFVVSEVNGYWIKQSNLGHVCCVMNKALLSAWCALGFQADSHFHSLHARSTRCQCDYGHLLCAGYRCHVVSVFNNVLLCICLDTSCFYSFVFSVLQWSLSVALTLSSERVWWRAATGQQWPHTQATGAHMT